MSDDPADEHERIEMLQAIRGQSLELGAAADAAQAALLSAAGGMGGSSEPAPPAPAPHHHLAGGGGHHHMESGGLSQGGGRVGGGSGGSGSGSASAAGGGAGASASATAAAASAGSGGGAGPRVSGVSALASSAANSRARKTLELDVAMGRKGVEVAEELDKSHKFWSTQPVPKLASKVSEHGPLEPIRSVDDVPKTPLALVKGFQWCDIDIRDPEQLNEMYNVRMCESEARARARAGGVARLAWSQRSRQHSPHNLSSHPPPPFPSPLPPAPCPHSRPTPPQPPFTHPPPTHTTAPVQQLR